jgi:glycosyltransferase involved in cell wall biosynthesis
VEREGSPRTTRQPSTILVIHERYREAGGEDAVVAAETALLRERGHRVETLIEDNASIPDDLDLPGRIRLAVDTVWSRRAVARVRSLVRRLKPDVVHVHNTLPLLSPAVHRAAHAEGVATVQTLHNYRLVCPVATLFRDGRPCEDCVGQPIAWPGVLHACYRGSRAQTATVAAMLAFHRARRTWWRDVDRFVALTDFARGRLVAGGLPVGRIDVKPNFVTPDAGPRTASGSEHLFLGRLVPEKGVRTLLAALASTDPRVSCRIAGSGPLEGEVRAAAGDGIVPLGQLDRASVLHELHAARAVVVPSTWYEGFPIVLVEAFAAGVPVIASRIGSLAELVEDGRTGILVEPGDAADLGRALAWSHDHPDEMRAMGLNARQRYEACYTPEVNYGQLMAVYARAISRRKITGPTGPPG